MLVQWHQLVADWQRLQLQLSFSTKRRWSVWVCSGIEASGLLLASYWSCGWCILARSCCVGPRDRGSSMKIKMSKYCPSLPHPARNAWPKIFLLLFLCPKDTWWENRKMFGYLRNGGAVQKRSEKAKNMHLKSIRGPPLITKTLTSNWGSYQMRYRSAPWEQVQLQWHCLCPHHTNSAGFCWDISGLCLLFGNE